MAAVTELGFAPDGAARALSARLKEVVGVIVRRPWRLDPDEDLFSAESESLQPRGGRPGMNQTCDRCGPAVRAVYRASRGGQLYLCGH